MIKELSPKEGINKEELFQTLMLERHKRNDIKDLGFREVLKNMHAFESPYTYDGTNYKEVTTAHNQNFSGRRD